MCLLISKYSFEARFTDEGDVADWHPIDLGSKVVRQRDGECAERPAGYIEAEKTSARNVDESLRKYMGDFQHSLCCARESCNNKKVRLICI